MGEVLNWDEESAGYIRARGDRYPGGLGLEPDPKSRMGASRFIGFSADAGACWSSSPSGTPMATCTASTHGRRPERT